MANEQLARLYRENLESNPYQGREYLADDVGQFPNMMGNAETDWSSLHYFAREIWRLARMALNFWTPERVEEEAYRRAGDVPSVSKIARELARFNVIYGKWVEMTHDLMRWSHLDPYTHGHVGYVRESISETLVALERRAQAAEQRATDLRLRYEFDKLRAVVTGRAMASEIAILIQDAIANAGTEQAVYERFAPRLDRLERDIQETKLETRFIADLAGEEFVAKQLPAKRVVGAAEKLVEVIPGGKIVAAILRLIAKQ